MQIKGFIFDLDGVITDTAEYHYLAWKQLADEEGLPFTRADNDALRGISRRESLIRLLKGRVIPEETMQTWMERKNSYYTDYLERVTPQDSLPGVRDFLREARTAGLKLGLGSASKNARVVVDKLQLAAAFDIIGDGYVVANPKPAPDLFVWVAGGLGLPVTQVAVFEDAEAGIDAAKSAGCLSVGIGTAQVSHADVLLPNLAAIRLDEILTQLQAVHSSHE